MSVPTAYVGTILIWSTTPLGIAWSTVGSNPSFAVFVRMLIGAGVCALLVWGTRTGFPFHRQAQWNYVVSGLSMASSMSLTYWAAQYVGSGLISVLFGLSPLLTSLGAMIWLQERRLTRYQVLGLLLGLAGMFGVFYGSIQFDRSMAAGLLALLLAVLLQAAGLIGMKHLNEPTPPLATTLGALLVALPCFGLVWLIHGAPMPHTLSLQTLGAIAYLGVFGSVLGFFFYYYLIQRIESGSIALITLITPVLALLLGRVLNHEVILPEVWLGAVCIILGLALHHARDWRARWGA